MSQGTKLGVTHCTACGRRAALSRDGECDPCRARYAYADAAIIERDAETVGAIVDRCRAHPSGLVSAADLLSPCGLTPKEAWFEYALAAGEAEHAAGSGLVSLTLPRHYLRGLAMSARTAVSCAAEGLMRLAADDEPILDALAAVLARARFVQQVTAKLDGDPETDVTLVVDRGLLRWLLDDIVGTYRDSPADQWERDALPFFERLLDAARDETSPVIVGTEAT